MSVKVVHRLYLDFEREERWLNEQGALGWHLVRYSLGSYRFEQGAPGAFFYRIELLPAGRNSTASRDYLSLLADSGIEMVSTYMRWIYLRGPAASGPFELFTDLESRIGHYRRVLGFFGVILAALVCSAASLIVTSGSSGGVVRYLPLSIVALALILIAVPTVRFSRHLRSLKGQRQIYE